MRCTVDRIEGTVAVVITDDDTVVQIPLCDLPVGVREGNILSKYPNGELYIDYEAEEEERKRLQRLKEKLLKPKI